MADKYGAWGIEIGASALKAVRLIKQENQIVVADWEIIPFKKMLTTPDLNVPEAIQVNLDKLKSKHKLNKGEVVVSVPGHSAFARFAKLPPVDPKRIRDIVRFEAQQQIPFPIDQVEWDYQVFIAQDSPDVEVGIFAMTKDRVMEHLANYRALGVRVDALTLSPVAVCNAMRFDEQLDTASPGVVYMDIGTISTDIIIVEQGQVWLRTLPIGGNHFTEALVRAFKLSFPKADKLKREAGTSKYARQIFQAMRPVFSDLVQEVQRSLGYYQSLNRDAELTRVVGLGSTFRLPGMIKFLKQQLQMDVVRPDGFKRIVRDGPDQADFAEHAMNLATAYGLALQGIEAESINANLLPRHILKQRLWRGKQPWIAAAAAVLAVAAVLSFTTLARDRAAYAQSKRENAAQIDRIVGRASELRAEFQTLAGTDPRVRIENLRRILDYRDVWPKLLKDLSLAMASLGPQPQTLEPDWEAVSQVPRRQRRRMFIDKIDVTYDFMTTGGQTISAGVPQASAMSYEEIFGARRRSPAQRAPEAVAGTSPTAVSSTNPPSFVIRITGTTPLAAAARDLADTFINWLKSNAQRDDRPYEIIAGTEALVRVERVGRVEASTSSQSLSGSVRPGAAKPRFGGQQQAQGEYQERTAQLNQKYLYPNRPGTDESAEGDFYFEIEFRVQLIRPDDARMGERRPERRADAASPPDGSEADS